MKRDMELMRKILFAIETEYQPGQGFLFGVKIEGYDMLTIAEHCDFLYQQGLIKEYKPNRGGGKIVSFQIGNLTNSGYDFIELIRNEDIWKKTEKEIEEKKLPKTIEWFAKVAGIFTGNMVKELNG